ncbi:probable U3 small nucleolar RNA-associated protein 11 [Trichonephila clavata]|uniref:U3 small nucleolar RNA-associated protein 11 n=1 Tax=Trichonephila clavata TaxID=2740835 RepID=A0A8X6H0T1_TRICU|nr:probable U3 small nucleolar RNA-associated protein 11 [Trichonephila clavata]
MSSFAKIAKTGRREFKERHQPENRKKFGFLEKKKDYKLRARAHHVNENKLKKLYRKAMYKNPNEFCYHMINSEIRDDLHYEKEKPVEHSEAQKKLMQTQDSNYINYKLSTEIKKIEKLRCSAALLNVEDRPKNTHTFYLDSKKEAKKLDIAKKLNTHPDLLDRTFNRPTLDALKNMKLQDYVDNEAILKASRQINNQYNELSKRMERAQELKVLSQKLEVKKNLMHKRDTEPKLLKPASTTNAPVYVWYKERKR